MSTSDIARLRAFLARPGVTKRLLTDAAKLGRNALQGVEDDGWQASDKTMRLLMTAIDRIEAAIS